jgi:hypothetical protein
VIAGGDHPQAAGYTESVRRKVADNGRIEFKGYVPEDALPHLFQSSSVAVMPYSSSTGCSGVAHLACAYGVPIACADLSDFRQMAQSEELAIQFYPAGNAQGLAECIVDLLQNPDRQQLMATQNFSAALRMTMPNVVQKYLRHFELQQRVQTLKYVSRFRRLPRWMPSKSLLLRFMTRNSLGWARRSAVLHSTWNGRDDFRLLNGNGHGRGQLDGTGTALNGDGVGGSPRDGSIDHAATGPTTPTAGRASDNHRSQNTSAQHSDDAPALHLADQGQSEQTETDEPGSSKEVVPLAVARGRNLSRGNGQNGTDRSSAGRDGGGRE